MQQTPGGWLGGSAAQLEICWRLKSGSQKVLAVDSKPQAEGTMRRRTDPGVARSEEARTSLGRDWEKQEKVSEIQE